MPLQQGIGRASSIIYYLGSLLSPVRVVARFSDIPCSPSLRASQSAHTICSAWLSYFSITKPMFGPIRPGVAGSRCIE